MLRGGERQRERGRDGGRKEEGLLVISIELLKN
jgi:hypothetical protein